MEAVIKEAFAASGYDEKFMIECLSLRIISKPDYGYTR